MRIFTRIKACRATSFLMLFMLTQLSVYGQTSRAKSYYYKFSTAAHRALGDVMIKGSGVPFYGNVFKDGTEEVQTNHESNYWRPISLSFGKNISDRYTIGLGFDIDVYGLGGSNRGSFPIYLEGIYNFGLSKKGTFFLSLKPGYSIGVESALHSGGKLETALGYEFKGGQNGRLFYGLSLGYNYQELKNVSQAEMHRLDKTNGYTEVGKRFVDVSVSSLPLTFFIRL